MNKSVFIFVALLFFSVGRVYADDPFTPPPLDDAVPQSLDLSPDFRIPTNAVINRWIAWDLHGTKLARQKGIDPIYVTRHSTDDPAHDLLVSGDIIMALNGKPLASNPFGKFRQAVANGKQTTGVLWVTRWRKGEIDRVMLDLGTKPLDLTRGAKPNLKQEDWNLGATGAEGWIWSTPNLTTEGSTQIYITQVREGSSADGLLEVGDVVLGALGKPFVKDARKEFANALTAAEMPQKNGKLSLMVWREGKRLDVTVPLKVMGRYTETSPIDCPKAKQIIDDACAYFETTSFKSNDRQKKVASYMNALGLLATGRDAFLPMLQAYAAEITAESKGTLKKLESEANVNTWTTAYANLFLTEYYLLTQDQAVLPGIREYTLALARGQSRGGTWGHYCCVPMQSPDGPIYGINVGYGAMNQSSLIAWLSLILAQKCGVEDQVVTHAIQKSSRYFRDWVDKGSIPYGDYGSWMGGHDDNGKCSVAAVAFDILGDKEAATFFARMTLASFEERESGHTGNYFSFLWGALGAARGGEEASASFMKRLRWFYDLERRADGSFMYQGKPGMANRRTGEHQYIGWDCTGARLLAYCLPLQNLYITGKGGGVVETITGRDLDTVIASGVPNKKRYGDFTTEQLLQHLQSWSPIVRHRAAEALEAKEDDVSGQLITMIDSDERYTRYGALMGLRHAGRGSIEAADAIVEKGLLSEDPMMRYLAMNAFTLNDPRMGLSGVADKAVNKMLHMAVKDDPNDPAGKLKNSLCYALFKPPHRGVSLVDRVGVDKLPRDLLLPAIRELLKVSNGAARSDVSRIYDKLSAEDLAVLWKDIYQATIDLAPANMMFASGVRVEGLRLMARHGAKEGLEACVSYLRYQKPHGSDQRILVVLDLIVNEYGSHAKAYIDELEKHVKYFDRGEPNSPIRLGRIKAQRIREAIFKIKATKTSKHEKLISILMQDDQTLDLD